MSWKVGHVLEGLISDRYESVEQEVNSLGFGFGGLE